jgi:hemerythrin
VSARQGKKMPKIIWDSSYSVGDSTLDGHHKKLLALTNRLADCAGEHSPQADSQFHEILNELAVYARLHFAAEEKLLSRCNYPLLTMHREEHAKFEKWLAETLVSAADGELDKNGLQEFLAEWWREHILVKDMHYHDYLG